MRQWPVLATLLVLRVGGAAAGGIQTPSAVQLDTVTVTAAIDNSADTAITASEGLVTVEQLENRPRLRVGELLEVVPGLIVTQHSGDGKANQYFLRGFNLDHGTDFRTEVDGMPVNLPTHAHGQGYSDLNFVIPELVDNIRYQKGVYYAQAGDFSAAGNASMTLADHLPGFTTLEVGDFGYQRLVSADTLHLGGGALLLGGEAQHFDGPWDVAENNRKFNALARWSRSAGNDTYSVTAMGYGSRWTSTDQIPQRAVDEGLIDRYGSLNPSDGGESQRYSLSARWVRTSDTTAWRADAYLVRYRFDLFSDFTYFLNDPVNGDQFQQSDRRSYGGGKLTYEHHGNLFGLHNHQEYGVEFRRDDIGRVGLYHTVDRVRIGTVREDAVDQTSLSAYATDTTYWTPWLRSVAGLRLDQYLFDVRSNNPLNGGQVNSALGSPKLSLIFGPWKRAELFVSSGYGFHSNDARGTTITVDPGTGDPANRVTPLVRAKGSEIGLKMRPANHLQTALTLWTLALDSELVFTGDAGSTEPSRPSHREGVELSAYWTPFTHVIVDADMALSHARFTDHDPVGNDIPEAIEKTVSTGVVYNNNGLGFFGGARLRYFGSRPLIEDNSQRSAASLLVNLRGGYAINPHLKAAVDVFNVFNRQVNDIDYYYTSRLSGEPAEGVNDDHFHPAEPRSVRASLRYQW
jgi:TonB dependent receptor/TonB-dependent Receptor Plug Domain